jgi:outer membrane protein assembly factor BamB
MNKKKIVIFLLLLLLNQCSFDDKTGFWSGSKKEINKLSDLDKKNKKILDVYKIYASDEVYTKEVTLKNKLTLANSKINSTWEMLGLNHQNYLSNISLPSIENIFLKKNVGKKKLSHFKKKSALLFYNNSIIFADKTGTVFAIDESGKTIWKKKVYKKLYKNIQKNLVISVDKNFIYVADDVGFLYSLNVKNGELIWIKNHGIPIKSNIKVFNNKIYLIDSDNKILCFSSKDGSKIWDVLTISSFIKRPHVLPLSFTKNGNLIALNSSADLYKLDGNSGKIIWSANILGSLQADASDFFISSNIVISDNVVFLSSEKSFLSYDLEKGNIIWETNVSTISTPIVIGDNIFIVTENGYFVILNKFTGEIISSKNILKILKEKHQFTKITSFIIGSGKLYSLTLNGHIIVSSASNGTTESFKKIADSLITPPIIVNEKLFILTDKFKILGFN